MLGLTSHLIVITMLRLQSFEKSTVIKLQKMEGTTNLATRTNRLPLWWCGLHFTWSTKRFSLETRQRLSLRALNSYSFLNGSFSILTFSAFFSILPLFAFFFFPFSLSFRTKNKNKDSKVSTTLSPLQTSSVLSSSTLLRAR